MKVGVAGLGAMGANVAARLMEVGHQVTVWNRTADKAKPLADAGAKVVASPAEVAAASEAVITMLTDGAAIDAVYNGPNGLLSGDVKGKMFIEMSTVAPKVETDLAPKVRAKGAAMIECPVGGSTAPARKGQLLGLMGAEPADADARAAAARTALPQGRALRAGRRRRGHEARHQPAADGGLAGLWRGVCDCAQRRLGAQAPARSVRREQRRQQRAQDARRDDRQDAGEQGSGPDNFLDRQRREGPAHHGGDRRGAGRRHGRDQGRAVRISRPRPRTASAAATARR